MFLNIKQKTILKLQCSKPCRFLPILHPSINLLNRFLSTNSKPNFLYQPTYYSKCCTCKKSSERAKHEQILVNLKTPVLGFSTVNWLNYCDLKEYNMASPKVLKGRIVVYSIVGCPHCLAAKSTLQDLGLSQTFTDLENWQG